MSALIVGAANMGTLDQQVVSDQGGSKWVDWRGRPINHSAHQQQRGGWKGAICTIVSAGLGYFAYSGIYSNLILYLIRVWNESNAGAANHVNTLLGTLFFTAFIGAFLGDAYWGRLSTVPLFLLIFAVGCMLVAMVATLQEASDMRLKSVLLLALYMTALGCGSYEPGITALGADQFDSEREKAIYFNWIFAVCNLGEVPALTILTYVENNGRWALGFWISTAIVLVSFSIFLVGAPYCRQCKPGGNPILRIAQVLVAAAHKRGVTPESNPKLLYEVPGDHLKIQHRDRFRWLDKAATITDNDLKNRWKLCTVTQVEEVKGWLGILPVLMFGAIAQAVNVQMRTLFVEQAAIMDGRVGKTQFKIPPGSMQLVFILVASTFAPVYGYVIIPLSKRWSSNPKGITSLQRIGSGMATATMAMVVAALVERRRLEASRLGDNLSIFWLTPQFAICGLSVSLFAVGQIEFFYTEISESVRSLGICLTLVCRGLGFFMSSLLLTTVTSITSHHNGKHLVWIPHDLNLGHLDYFYWFLACLMFFTLVLYIIYAYHYTYLEQPNLNVDIDTPSKELESD